MTFEPTPLTIVGPAGTRAVVDHIMASLEPDLAYRIEHHDDLQAPPQIDVIEVGEGVVDLPGAVQVRAALTDHKPVEPSVGFRFDFEGASVVAAGDTVPCNGLDSLCHGADALIHTVIRKDIIENVPIQRMKDTLDYHSSPGGAAQTASRGGVGTLVLTYYVPPIPTGGDGADWRTLASEHFSGAVEIGDDLHHIEITKKDN